MFPKRRLTAVLLLVLILSLVTACSLLNSPPVADFFVFPDSGSAPLVVTFNASSSSDTGGIIVAYQWEFGDETTGSGKTKTHTYELPGEYIARLTVTDDDGAKDSTIQTIQVDQAAITASFVANPTSGESPLGVDFDASGSFDSDGETITYAWRFGDGSTGTGVVIRHTYYTTGTYTVLLMVCNESGDEDQATATITVSEAPTPGNAEPNAWFTLTPNNGEAPLTVSFDASGSWDSDGYITSYAWTFGDGGSSSGVTANHTYNTTGTYTAQLTVTDDDGATGTATRTIQVPATPSPSGATWELHTTTTEGSHLYAISMATANDGWAVSGKGQMYHYNGTSWTLHTTTAEESRLYAIDMVTSSDGWAVGNDGRIYRFDGTNWTLHTTTAEGVTLWAIDMVTSSDGWAVGNDGRFYRFNGTSWTLYTTPVEWRGFTLRTISMVTASDGWAVGEDGRFYHFNGTSWTLHTATTEGTDLLAISMVTANDGWAVGSYSRIYHFNGTSWTLHTTTAEGFTLWAISMVTASDGWVVGGSGLIYHYDGTSWTLHTTTTEGSVLRSISIEPASGGWVVGNYGRIYHGTL